MSTSTEIISQTSLEDAFSKVRPRFMAVPQEQILAINTDVFTAVSTVRASVPRIVTLRPQLEKLIDFDIVNVDDLDLYALAALRANYLFLSASTPPERFQDLVVEGTELHTTLVSDFTAAVNRGYISRDKLDLLQGSVGHRNVASDLIMISTVMTANWDKIAGRSGVTMEELVHAQELGVQLNIDLGQRVQAPVAVAAVSLERQQAFTLFVRAYDQVRRGISYLRWDEDDVDTIAPSIYAGRKRKSSTDAKTKPAVERAAKMESAAPAASAELGAATKPAVGLPGADPFVH
jgi:hypothetical protein